MDDRKRDLKNQYKNRERHIGVFQITNTKSGKIFIGTTVNLEVVFNKHRSQLNFGGHPTKELQKDWDELGPDYFSFEIIDEIKPNDDPNYKYRDDLETLEELWLDRLQPYEEKGYHKRKIKK